MSTIAIIGAGPAGLLAAEILSAKGHAVALYDSKPSVGRKFLMAGKGGLNLTHSEPLPQFIDRYANRADMVKDWLEVFGPEDLKLWAKRLGIETFIGSSGRVFPQEMKAAPLLRAWVRRLREQGVRFHMRHHWIGSDENNQSLFETAAGVVSLKAEATLLALGGGSWPQLGSTGKWFEVLAERGILLSKLRPSNCGFECVWSEHIKQRFSGQPIKTVTAWTTSTEGKNHRVNGDFIITQTGVEGGLIYSLSAPLRDLIETHKTAILHLDLAPGHCLHTLKTNLSRARGKRSLANHLTEQAGIHGIKAGLLREFATTEQLNDPLLLAEFIKDLPITLTATRPLEEAISSAGGVYLESLDEHLMLKQWPGTFCAGEMLDWEAPTGGYLLTACFASGYKAAQGILHWLR